MRQHARGDGQIHDRLRVLIGLHDDDLFDAVRQPAGDSADRFAHVRGNVVEVHARAEFDVHAPGVLFGSRTNTLNTCDPRDGAFEQADDLGVHRLGGCTGERHPDGHDRPVDVRQFADFDRKQGGKSGKHDQQIGDQDQYRPPHAEAGKVVSLTHRRLVVERR